MVNIAATIVLICIIAIASIFIYMFIMSSQQSSLDNSVPQIQPLQINSELEYNTSSGRARLYLKVLNMGSQNVTLESIIIHDCNGAVLQVLECPKNETVIVRRREVMYNRTLVLNSTRQVISAVLYGVNASIQINSLKIISMSSNGYTLSYICLSNIIVITGYTIQIFDYLCIILDVVNTGQINAIFMVYGVTATGQGVILDISTLNVGSGVHTYNISATFTRSSILTNNLIFTSYLDNLEVLRYRLTTFLGTLSSTPLILTPFDFKDVTFSLKDIVYRINDTVYRIIPKFIVSKYYKYVTVKYTYTSTVKPGEYEVIVIQFKPKFKIRKNGCYYLTITSRRGLYTSYISEIRLVR